MACPVRSAVSVQTRISRNHTPIDGDQCEYPHVVPLAAATGVCLRSCPAGDGTVSLREAMRRGSVAISRTAFCRSAIPRTAGAGRRVEARFADPQKLFYAGHQNGYLELSRRAGRCCAIHLATLHASTRAAPRKNQPLRVKYDFSAVAAAIRPKMTSLNDLAKNAAISANSPSFLAATPPISAARP